MSSPDRQNTKRVRLCRQSDAPSRPPVIRLNGIADEEMTGTQSRLLNVGARVIWNGDKNDAGTVIEKNWAGVTIKWDNREVQHILHNDMTAVTKA